MPPMRRPQMPKDTAQTTPRGLAAERPDEGASGDENHNVNIPQFKPPGDSLSEITESSDVARLLADMLEMDDVINVRAANVTTHRTEDLTCPARRLCAPGDEENDLPDLIQDDAPDDVPDPTAGR